MARFICQKATISLTIIFLFIISAGQGATAYDVVINPDFYKELDGRKVLFGFLITVILEGLEHKNNIELSRGISCQSCSPSHLCGWGHMAPLRFFSFIYLLHGLQFNC